MSEVFDTSALPEVFFDDIDNLSLISGVFRCTLYALRRLPGLSEPVMVPVLNVALPAVSVMPVAGKAVDLVAIEGVKAAKELVRSRIAVLCS